MSREMAEGERIRVDGYLRVSKVNRRRRPRFISPAMQRDEIEAWADARGARVLNIYEERNESGARADRPQLDEAVRRIEAGISQGIVVSKVDRFGRSLIDGLATIERVQTAGGTFFAVHDGLDLSTDTGRLVLRIMLSMAEWELERIRDSWDRAHARSIARGAWPVSTTPVGYRRTRGGRLRPNPSTADVITELFRRRARGESGPRLARWLEEQGVPTARGNPGWSWTATYSLLSNRVYLGETHWGGVDPVSWTLECLGREARAGRMSRCREPDLRIRRSSAARRLS